MKRKINFFDIIVFIVIPFISATAGMGYYLLIDYTFISYMFASAVTGFILWNL